MLQLDRSVQRVTLVKADAAGGTSTTLLYQNPRRRRKRQSVLLRPMERFTRRVMQAMADGAQTYINLHEQSNRKKSNGWGYDLFKNTTKAQRRVWQTLTR